MTPIPPTPTSLSSSHCLQIDWVGGQVGSHCSSSGFVDGAPSPPPAER